MSRAFAILIGVLTCVAAGVAGAFAGFCTESRWPRAPEDFNYTLGWGLGIGVFGALVTISFMADLHKDRRWVPVAVGGVFTLLGAFARMWWFVLSSLG